MNRLQNNKIFYFFGSLLYLALAIKNGISEYWAFSFIFFIVFIGWAWLFINSFIAKLKGGKHG